MPPRSPCRRPCVPLVVAFTCAAFPAALARAEPAPAPAAPVPAAIAMEDQFRNRRDTAVLRGDVVVLVYAERRGAPAALELGRTLHVHFHPTAATAPPAERSRQPVRGLPGWPADARVPDVHVIPIACLPEIPKAFHAVARARFRQDSEFVPVWLDFADTMRSRFGIVPGGPNVVVLDTEGRVRDTRAGALGGDDFRRFVEFIDGLRLAARPAADPAAARPDIQRR